MLESSSAKSSDTALWPNMSPEPLTSPSGFSSYFRRGSAPKALHFYLLCFASFILSSFTIRQTEHFRTGDLLEGTWRGIPCAHDFPTSSLSFPEAEEVAAGLAGDHAVCSGRRHDRNLGGSRNRTLRTGGTLIEVRGCSNPSVARIPEHLLHRRSCASRFSGPETRDPVVRPAKLTWLRKRSHRRSASFTLFYVLPYVLERSRLNVMKLSVLTLPFYGR